MVPAIDLEALSAEQARVHRPRTGTEHGYSRGQDRQQEMRPLIVRLREAPAESDTQLIEGNRYPGDRRPQSDEQKKSAGG